MAITIRSIETISECRTCEAIQREAWAMPDDLEVVPLHILITAQKNGGLLLGAFDGDALLGFVFGFAGLGGDGKLKHCSHMMAVLPELQSSGIGYRLKLAQREFVLGQGLDLVTWTYDPLESRNAYLNVAKLGGVGRRYYRDIYGAMADGLNAGVPSDRFEIEWWLESDRVKQRIEAKAAEVSGEPGLKTHETHLSSSGCLAPGTPVLDARATTIWIEIPADFQAIKAADPNLALEWRLTTRELFEFYFGAGYAVVDFLSSAVDGVRRSYYVARHWSQSVTSRSTEGICR
jgi:predicted GNAT superfamily acetyltransferase